MMMQNRYNGFASFDAMLSIVPMLLIFVFLLQLFSFISLDLESTSRRQDTFNSLVSIADYTVKSGAVRTENGIRYPNWIVEDLITEGYVAELRDDSGLESLYISLEPSNGHGTCIYRIVVTGEEKKISRLFVCGD